MITIAVIVVHTLAAIAMSAQAVLPPDYARLAIATLTYDSFAARGTTGAALQASPGYLPIGVADAYAALRFLSREPRIDAKHIAIIGFSTAPRLPTHRLRSAAVGAQSNDQFAAHVAFYPSGTFGAVASGAYTGSPVLMLLGDKDDNLAAKDRELSGLRQRSWGAGSDPEGGLSRRSSCLDSP